MRSQMTNEKPITYEKSNQRLEDWGEGRSVSRSLMRRRMINEEIKSMQVIETANDRIQIFIKRKLD